MSKDFELREEPGPDGTITLHGGVGDDSIQVSNHYRTVHTELGDVQIVDGVTVKDGAGNTKDYLGADAENLVIDGGAGDDTIEAAADLRIGVEFRGGADDDVLKGGSAADNLSGGDGHDEIVGGDGNDTLDGGWGHDEIYGEAGHDIMAGGFGHDEMYGGSGNDEMRGGVGIDSLSGGDDDDRMYADERDDVDTGAGADEVEYE